MDAAVLGVLPDHELAGPVRRLLRFQQIDELLVVDLDAGDPDLHGAAGAPLLRREVEEPLERARHQTPLVVGRRRRRAAAAQDRVRLARARLAVG